MTTKRNSKQGRHWGGIIVSFLEDQPPTRTAEGEATTLEASVFNWAHPPEQVRTRDGNVLTTTTASVQICFFPMVKIQVVGKNLLRSPYLHTLFEKLPEEHGCTSINIRCNVPFRETDIFETLLLNVLRFHTQVAMKFWISGIFQPPEHLISLLFVKLLWYGWDLVND